jgi:S-layer homology domain
VSYSQLSWRLPIIFTITHFFRWGCLRSIFTISLVLLCGCNGQKSLQNTLAPDPQLNKSDGVATTAPEPSEKASGAIPADFPRYPQAKLQTTEQIPNRGTVTTWTTSDPIDLVYAFYQKELAAKQWQIITKPSDSEPKLVAKLQQTSISVAKPLEAKIAPQVNADKQQSGITVYTIDLQAATNSPEPTPEITPIPTSTPTSSPTPSPAPTVGTKPTTSQPAATAEYLTDLGQIGVLTTTDTAAPNRIVTRREYAQWLLAAYNRINSSKPTQQIKLATKDAKPAFQDVPVTHPDFTSIQGLAEAGLIASPLSGEATAVLFRPDAPLTREQMILWKVPLDTHQSLPGASLDAVKQTWGFQDAGKIDPQALRAVLADFQNGDRSNIRRAFGYTTLFQPKKTVNLGEVATSIWYFGANSEGLSAREVLKTAK